MNANQINRRFADELLTTTLAPLNHPENKSCCICQLDFSRLEEDFDFEISSLQGFAELPFAMPDESHHEWLDEFPFAFPRQWHLLQYDDLELVVIRGCNHLFCMWCIANWFITSDSCSMCRQELDDIPDFILIMGQSDDPIFVTFASEWEKESYDAADFFMEVQETDETLIQEVTNRALLSNMPVRRVLAAHVTEHASFSWDFRHLYSNLTVIMAQMAYRLEGVRGQGLPYLPFWDPLYNNKQDDASLSYQF